MSAELIKLLREETGISLNECKKAVDEAAGDLEKAREILKERSIIMSEKKGDRELAAGTIGFYVHNNKQLASLVELLCETDFVAKNENFEILAKDIAMHVAVTGTDNLDVLLEESFIKDTEMTIKSLIQSASQKLGERVELGKVSRISVLG
jgi:elongation factor Ts